jgi:hypothetical protein
LVGGFAAAVGEVACRPDPPVAALEALLDRWAAMPKEQAPTDRPEVVLPCAAVAAYGEVGASGDPDLRWVVRKNLKRHRLRRWPARLDHVRALLDT